MSVDYVNRLRTDPRVEGARRRMELKRLTDPALWTWVIEQVASIPRSRIMCRTQKVFERLISNSRTAWRPIR